MQPLKLAIETDGTITAIHDDALAPLYLEGRADITRASSVEPHRWIEFEPATCHQSESITGWLATMNDGTKLGPYRLRSEALAAEVAYLEKQLGL